MIETIRRAENRIKDIDYKISTLNQERILLNLIIENVARGSDAVFLIKEYKQLYQNKQPWLT